MRSGVRAAVGAICSMLETMDGTTATGLPSAIRPRREALGLSQRELAGQAGLSLRTVVALEHGEANPGLPVLWSCFGALGLVISIHGEW